MDGQVGGHGGGPGGRVEGHHVPLHVLAHVQPQHRRLQSKVASGEGLGELLLTPVGLQKSMAAMGRSGSVRPTWDRFTAREMAETASSCPMTRHQSSSSSPARTFLSSVISCCSGIPDHSAATAAISSAPTSPS